MSPSNYETFWQHGCYAVVGHSDKRAFPRLTYGALKKQGKVVFPVDPSSKEIEGDAAYPDLGALPGPVDGVVIEVPREETTEWVERAGRAGIKDVWLHMNTECPEALAAAKRSGINARYGTCAVMYLTSGPSVHTVHRWIRRAKGLY
jgi:predicted CoA-binding protein